MRYCRRCILPDTRPNLVIGPDGVCNACKAHATKKEIDWIARAAALREVVRAAKSRSHVEQTLLSAQGPQPRVSALHGYDCVIPVSGGKDSTWQVVQCLELGLKPLAVTWKTPGRTEIGVRNLANLIGLGVDHIDYQINPKVESRFMLEALTRYGSTAIPMHLAIFNIPATIAVRFRIPLIVWGENSAFEYGSADEERTGARLDRAWMHQFGVTHGTTAADWVSEQLTARDLTAYFGPTDEELDAAGVTAIFLGYYLEWDPEKTYRVAADHGFVANAGGARTGLYDYADIDDDFISVHHWLKWHKFGFTRTWDNLALEIRNGRMTREQAIEIIREKGDETPHEDIRKLCAFLGIDVARFHAICETFRNPAIWYRDGGTWKIRDFLIPDFRWV